MLSIKDLVIGVLSLIINNASNFSNAMEASLSLTNGWLKIVNSYLLLYFSISMNVTIIKVLDRLVPIKCKKDGWTNG